MPRMRMDQTLKSKRFAVDGVISTDDLRRESGTHRASPKGTVRFPLKGRVPQGDAKR